MFIPLGVIWPFVYRELNTAWKAFLAGFGVSLCIELLQLPFYTRVSDVDDLILNTVGFMIGYLLYLLIRLLKQGFRRTPKSA
jgi:glycopeptide antibiotics resistance protein